MYAQGDIRRRLSCEQGNTGWSKVTVIFFYRYSLPLSSQHKCYIVATCDRDLKRRIRKIPGVPIMYISQHRYSIERMPDAFGGKRE